MNLRALRVEAYAHFGHLCNGLCPDNGPPGPDSRDPECFYCNVLIAVDELIDQGYSSMDAEQENAVTEQTAGPATEFAWLNGMEPLDAEQENA